MDDFDSLDTEEELRESYPHLYGGNEKPYEPPPIKLNAEQQAMLDKTRVESSPNAQRLMKTLVQLKKELKISILVLAHTKKRPPYQPIELAHINGSKMLSVFVESMFAIGASRRGKNIRYIKPLKHRYTPDRDAETEVASVRIGKEKNFLGFGFETLTDERSHIGWSYGHALQAEFAERVEQLAKEKMTQRAIAKELGVGPTTVNRCLKALRQKEVAKSL